MAGGLGVLRGMGGGGVFGGSGVGDFLCCFVQELGFELRRLETEQCGNHFFIERGKIRRG